MRFAHAKSSSLSKLCLASLLAVLLVNGTALALPGDVGTPAVDFSLEVFGGGTETLSQHSGQVVLLFIVGYG